MTKASRFPLDSNGVPIISFGLIEGKAEEFIAFFDSSCLTQSKRTALLDICVALTERYGIPFYLEDDLGDTDSGKRLLGRFHIASKAIYVSSSLECESPPWRFTLGHELGHFVLHRHLRELPADTEADLQPDYRAWRPAQWLEWHANKFAAALLMPRRPLMNQVLAKMLDLGVPNPHRLYLDDQDCNRRIFSDVSSHVGEVFGTSKTAVRIRLSDLGYLVDARVRLCRRLDGFLRHARASSVGSTCGPHLCATRAPSGAAPELASACQAHTS